LAHRRSAANVKTPGLSGRILTIPASTGAGRGTLSLDVAVLEKLNVQVLIGDFAVFRLRL
jgi:hypothetical protein